MGLDLVELVMELETEFGIAIPHVGLAEADTVGALFDCVVEGLPSEQRVSIARAYSGPLWERYLTVVERELGVARTGLRPEARFVADLGVS